MNIVQQAKLWVGQDFQPGKEEQCANFIRTVFEEAQVYLGVAQRPWDWSLTQGLEQGPEFANSFFSEEVGSIVTDINLLEPGDIIGFHSTYQGDFPEGCITHVGLYIGDNTMVHRPTQNLPVTLDPLEGRWRDHFSVAVRPLKQGSVEI